jgi:polar amino acid transport system substrate-binding protein
LRAAINLGNPVLAGRDEVSGEPAGVSVDLARELAGRLGVPVELAAFDRAAESVDAVRAERADIGFFAIDPARGEGLLFTAPYVLIEGSYLVPSSSPVTGITQVDDAGRRISVGAGSAYDLFLTREIRHAEIVRCPGARLRSKRCVLAPSRWRPASARCLRPRRSGHRGCGCCRAGSW